MAGGVCYRKGHERGAWYEAYSITCAILRKKAENLDCTFEVALLEAWSEYPGFEICKTCKEYLEGLAEPGSTRLSNQNLTYLEGILRELIVSAGNGVRKRSLESAGRNGLVSNKLATHVA